MTKLSSVRLQADIGSHVKRRAEAVRADGLILGRVISINYRKHTITYLAVATGSDNSANLRASIKNTAMLPMSMAGRNGYGKAYGSIIPIRVNDIVLIGFVNAMNSSPIVVARYPDETIASELSRVDTDEVDPRSILKYAMANTAFTLYPDQTYDLHDGHGNRVLTFSGKSFLLFNSDIPKLSHYTDNGADPKDYTDLPSSFFGNGQLIEPIADQAPEVMFKHQGIVDNQGNQDNHQLYLYISQDGNLRVSEMQKDQPWRTYFEGTAQGEIRLRRQEESKDFASGNVNSEISIDKDGIRLRRQEDSKVNSKISIDKDGIRLRRQEGSKVNSKISIDKDGQINLVDQGQGLIINKQGIYRADGTPLPFNAKDGQINLAAQGQGFINNKQGIYRADGTPLPFNANSENNNTSTNTKADTANTNADTANTKADTALNKADTALTKADTALNKADTALTKADTANTNADTALNKANTANTKADTALNKADTALTKADTALNKADTANTNADTANTNADTANTNAAKALNKADTANTKADTALNKADTANTNAAKALSDLNTGKYLTKDTLSSAPSFEALQTQVNNSAVGTNLLLGTGISVSATGNNSSNETQNTYNLADSMTAYDLYQKYGSTFTLSYDWVANDTSDTYSGAMQQQWNQVPWEIDDSNTISSSNKSGHKDTTFTLSSSSSNTATGFQFRLDNVPSTTTITISNMKLEKGSVATGWRPNPAEILTYQALNDFYMPTVKAYGAEGDGVTDDTVAIQKAIDANVNGAIAFPPGTYLINNTIKINQRCSLHFYGATIKAAKTMPAMFYTNSWNFEYSLNIISMIGDGASCLDLNNNASIGVRACGLILQTFSIKNLPDNAIGIKVDGISKIAGIMMMNSISTTGTVGIQFDITDCRLQHFVPVNIEKGIVVNQSSTYITDYHPWSVIMPMTNSTVGIQVNAPEVYLNDYYADTCFKGIEVSGPNTLIIINNFSSFWNTGSYNDQNSSPVPYLFYFDKFDKSYKGAHILVSNSVLWNSANIKGQYGFWSNLTDNSGFGLSNVQISKQTENINGIATQFLT